MHTYRDPDGPASPDQLRHLRKHGLTIPADGITMQRAGEMFAAANEANRQARAALRNNPALKKGTTIAYEDICYRITYIGIPKGMYCLIAVLVPRSPRDGTEPRKVHVADIAGVKEVIFVAVES